MSYARDLSYYLMDADRFMDWPGDGTGRPYQLVDGEPVAMSPPTQTHGRVQARLVYLLTKTLRERGSSCEVVVGPGVRPRPYVAYNVRVPDVAVTCTPDLERYVDNPTVVAEILSPSNEKETREAVRAMLSVPSLRDVLILGSELVRAEVLRRGADGAWPEAPRTVGPGETISLDSLGVTLSMGELYEGLGLV